jgi:hypothetical protein
MQMVNASVWMKPSKADRIGPPFLMDVFSIDLEKLGMWKPLQDLLASTSDDMRMQALWVIGTAVQNNPAAQKSVRHDNLELKRCLSGC